MSSTYMIPRGGRRKGSPKTGGRRKGTPNEATREIKEASRQILERPAYLKSLQKRLDDGKAPHMETLLHHYAYGKPKETMDIDVGHQFKPLKTLTDAELGAEILMWAEKIKAERAAKAPKVGA